MYPWSQPYVPHTARPLQLHPLSACLPVCCTHVRGCIHERKLRHIYRHRRRMSFHDCDYMPYPRPGASVWACYARHCHRVRVYQRAERRIRSRCTAPRRNFGNSASACARPLSTLVNRGSSHQHRRHSPTPSSPSLSQGQDLPLKPSHSSTGKKPPKSTEV